MSVDVLAGTHASGSEPVSQEIETSRGWWRVGVLVVLALVAVGTVGSFLSGATAPGESGAKLTHTIKRDNLLVTVTEQGTLESSDNTEIKCKVRGSSTVLWVIEAGTEVKPADELVRLDPSSIEDTINERKIVYQRALATHTRSEADVTVAAIAIDEYLQGTYRSQLKTLQKDFAIAESNLRTSKNMFEHSKLMFKRGYVSELEVEGNEFTVKQAQLELEVKQTQIDVLNDFTKKKEMETLQSNWKAAQAKLASDTAALDLEKARLDREEVSLENCVIVAESSGMVIHPSAAEWKERPDIEEGATVRMDQVLLMIPDLDKMQVKVGIHESKVDRIKTGMPARIALQDVTIDGTVFSVASITKPAGWWTGNVVKYDTVIEIDSPDGLKPGMSAEVEVVLAEHEDVPTIPVAAVVETEEEYFCWVKTAAGPQRRSLQLGDSNDQFIVVETGVKEGDEVVLNPLAFLEEAQTEALKPIDETKASKGSAKPKSKSSGKPKADKPAGEAKPEKSSSSDSPGTQLLKVADKNSDGGLTIDEYQEKDRPKFEEHDLNNDGKVDAGELDVLLKKLQAAEGE
ncbi:MAG: hypothetical protein CMJ64_19545 [Planctomycetaceae bacterium]|nr:hypothetical protein [Planctomycetaceae bacterium]